MEPAPSVNRGCSVGAGFTDGCRRAVAFMPRCARIDGVIQ